MNVEPTIGLAFLAGVVSFISPCVLPLVPAYIGYMGGHATTQSEQRGKFSTLLHGVFFVLGFTLFFVTFGLLTAAASSFLNSLGVNIPTILTRLGGVAVIFFGLYVMKLLDPVFAWLQRRLALMNTAQTWLFTLGVVVLLLGYFLWVFESLPLAILALLLVAGLFRNALQQARSAGDFWGRALNSLQNSLVSDTRNLEVNPKNATYLGSLGMGVVFSAGWTPCIGPIYGSVLTLAADSSVNNGSLLPAAMMLTAYSLGLGIPFLMTALALNQLSGTMKSLKRNMRKVEYASGILLILIGVLILSGSLEELSRRFGQDGSLGDLSIRLEACTAGAAQGRISAGAWINCVGEGMPKLNDRIVFAALKAAPAAALEAESILDLGNRTVANPLFTPDPNFDVESVPVGTAVGMRAPDFTSVTPDGRAVSLADFAGEVVLLNFWATWCGPCRLEMPEFQTVYEEYNKRGFNVVAVDFLEPAPQVQKFADELGLTFTIAMDESGAINDLYRIAQYPSSYILDGNGVILARHAGILSSDQLIHVLENLQSGG